MRCTCTCTLPLIHSHLFEGLIEREDQLTTNEVWQSHLSINIEPTTLEEATTCQDKVKWIKAMKNEIKSLEDNCGLE